MMHINVDLFKWFINSLMIKLLVEVLKMRNISNKNYIKCYTNQLLENSRKKSALIFYRQYLRC